MATSKNNAANVSAAKPATIGGVYWAPIGTDLPTDATTALPEDWKCFGYISEDGFTQETKREGEDVKAWGGEVVANNQTSYTDTFKLTFIEATNPEVLKLTHGADNVEGTSLDTGIHAAASATELEESAFVIDMVLRGNVAERIVYERAKLSETGEISYNDTDPVGYECTMTAFPGTDGKTHHKYFKKITDAEE